MGRRLDHLDCVRAILRRNTVNRNPYDIRPLLELSLPIRAVEGILVALKQLKYTAIDPGRWLIARFDLMAHIRHHLGMRLSKHRLRHDLASQFLDPLDTGVAGRHGGEVGIGNSRLIDIVHAAHGRLIREDLPDKALLMLDGGIEEGVEGSLGDIPVILHTVKQVSLTLDSSQALLEVRGPPRAI